MKLVLIFLSQILFNIFKTLEIKYTYQNKLLPLLVNSVFINLVSLATFYLSLTELLQDNFVVIFFFISGSVIGKWIAMKNIENINYRISKRLRKLRKIIPLKIRDSRYSITTLVSENNNYSKK